MLNSQKKLKFPIDIHGLDISNHQKSHQLFSPTPYSLLPTYSFLERQFSTNFREYGIKNRHL